MMRQSALFIIYLLTSISAISCVETIVMDPGEKDLPVMVNCLLTPDSKVQTLYLQYVMGKSAKEYIPITEAKVYVSSFFFTTTTKNYFHYVDGNRWESESFPVVGGRRYRLTVEIPGRDPIWAETTCPIAYRPALHTDLHEVHSMDYHSVYYQIEQFPTDKSHIKTSPVWVFAKGKLKTIEQCDENYPFIVTDHPYADDFNINGRKFSDLSFTGDFDGHCMSISWPAFHNMRRMMPELPLHDELVRIEHLDTNRFHILAGPIEYPKVGEPHQDHFVFSFVSDEYDKYLRSVYVKSRKTEHDITSIYSTESVYSNIEGGVGIFGSETTYRVGFLDM
jgi:hypothetical protein